MAENLWFYVFALLAIPFLYIITSILKFVKQTWTCTWALSRFPKGKYHWFWGHWKTFPGLNDTGLKKVIEWTGEFPRCFTFYLGPLRPILILVHPETVKVITRTAEPKMITSGAYALLRPWLGDGLLISSGNKWVRTRRLLTPGFHFDILKPYVAVYNDCANKLIQKLNAPNNESVEIFSKLRMCTLNIILKCAFSNNEEVQDRGDVIPYVKTVSSILRLILDRLLKPHLYNDFLYRRTDHGKLFYFYCEHSHKMAQHVITKRRQAIMEHGPNIHSGRYTDFLDILLLAQDEDGNGLTDVEIKDEVSTFLFAGHDTTATAMSWMLYNVAMHPQYQHKVHLELDELLNNRSEIQIQWDDLSKMPYLTMCIKESMRLQPPVPFISRQTTKATRIDDKDVPAGTIVNMCLYALHHNPAVWGKDHMSFKPDRFVPESINKMDTHAFIPFSAGPRNCIGQHFAMNEMKTILSRILYEFTVTVDESHTVELIPDLILRSKDGIRLYLQKRKK